jgi:hypothetical protein
VVVAASLGRRQHAFDPRGGRAPASDKSRTATYFGQMCREHEDRMSKQDFDVLDPPRSKLRALAASVERHVAELGAGQAQTAVQDLGIAWRALSNALALGPEPSLRGCPHCGRRIPHEATRCRYCMAHSPALKPAEVERQP